MIDLSKVKGLADDVKGAIKQITDAAGNVLWKSDNGMRKITVTRDYDGWNSARIYIGGYAGDVYADGGSCNIDDDWGNTWTSPTTIEVPVGTQIILETEYEDTYTKFLINGVSVYDDKTDWVEYDQYIVTKDVAIAMTREWVGQSRKYVMSITEE